VETGFGLPRKGVDANVVQHKFYVALDEGVYVKRRPILAALAHFCDVATGIIKQFD
jgi:hypothetical protein